MADKMACKGMAVSQAFIIHFKWYSLLHFVICKLLGWAFLFSSVFSREEQVSILSEVKNLFQQDSNNALANTEISEAVNNKLKMLELGSKVKKASERDGLVPKLLIETARCNT